MDRVMRGDPYTAVADWLDAEGIEPGPYVEAGRWTARLVVELLDDPILSGTRTFRDTICRPIFKTGKHKPVKNGNPETEHCPELAHLSVEEHSGTSPGNCPATSLTHRRYAGAAEASWHSPQPYVLARPSCSMCGLRRAHVLLGQTPAVQKLAAAVRRHVLEPRAGLG